uniref:KIB1-4 beta-propeller domain-containing protein n=2 Tax=Aegilops tauschii subsp. strangulata TaxID=200361 RepID=A0A453DM28_AEGTS
PLDSIEPVTTSWRLHSRNGVEDAVHHDGRFYTITYSGQLEAWEECDAYTRDVFTSTVIAPRLPLPADPDHRKYLVAAPGGRLMVVLTELKDRRTRSLKVLVLDAGREGWKETHDIDTVLFVGVNGSLCVPTREHPELKAGCVYYYNQGNPGACNGNYNYNGVWVFSLKDGIGEKFVVLGQYR